MLKNILTYASLLVCSTVLAQNNGTSQYDPHALFDPLFYSSNGTVTRAASGEPNVAYWQNNLLDLCTFNFFNGL